MDAQVAATARQFGGGSQAFAKLIQAVVDAEGGLDHILKAVQCSVDVSTLEEALEVVCRSATHHLAEYVYANAPQAFVQEFAASWAPVGAQNDPQHLNSNWPRNVLQLWQA